MFNIPSTRNIGKDHGFKFAIEGRNSTAEHGLMQKARSKMTGWKLGSLSMAGRVKLTKLALNSMHVFFMQLMQLSFRTHKELDKLSRRCICKEEN